jgi:hypothetical protein
MTTASSLIAEPLWRRARASFARAIDAVGAPAAIAAIAPLTRVLRRAIVERLLRLEQIVRKLLLAEAADIQRAERAKSAIRIERIPLRGMAMHWRPESRSASLQARNGAVVAEKREPDLSAEAQVAKAEGSRSNLLASRSNSPETWRAQFSFALPRDPHLVPDSRAPRIRALWGPYVAPPPEPERAPRIVREENAAFRLARRLEALRRVLNNPSPYAEKLARLLARAVKRFGEIVRRYHWAPSRTNAYDPEDEQLGIDAYGPSTDAPDVFSDSS